MAKCACVGERPVQEGRLKSSVGPLMSKIQLCILRASVAFAQDVEMLEEQRTAWCLLSCACFQQLFLFFWGISGIGARSPHWVLLRNKACFTHGFGHQLLFCLLLPWLQESLLQALAFTAGFPAPFGISLLPGCVLALISWFLWIQASFLIQRVWHLLNGSIVVFCFH